MASETHVPATRTGSGNKATGNVLQKLQKKTQPFQKFLNKFNNDWSMVFAGTLAFSLITAVIPILLAILSILGFILGADKSQSYLNQLNFIQGFNTLKPILSASLTHLSEQAGFLALIAIVSAVFGGSRLFLGLEGCLDIIYRVRPRTLIPQNIMALSMMILFIILVPLMFFMATVPAFVLNFIGTNPAITRIPFVAFVANNPLVISLAGFLGGSIAAFMLFEAIYVVVPNQRISWKNSWRGALVAAIAMALFISIVFPFYASRFLGSYAGQAGLVIVLLIFFYYFAVILLLGAEVNAFFFEHVQPLPNDLATFVSTMGGKLNHDRPDVEGQPHVNPKPTELADQTHVAEASEHEGKHQESKAQEQHTVAPLVITKNATPSVQTPRKHNGKLLTALEVVMGSILAMLIELFRLRRHGK